MIAFFFVGLFDQVKVNLTKDPGDWRTLFGIMLWILYLMMLLGGSMISLIELSSLVCKLIKLCKSLCISILLWRVGLLLGSLPLRGVLSTTWMHLLFKVVRGVLIVGCFIMQIVGRLIGSLGIWDDVLSWKQRFEG